MVSAKCGVRRNTISAFETDLTAPNNSALAVIRAALAVAGVEFIPENGGGAGVKLRKSGGPRRWRLSAACVLAQVAQLSKAASHRVGYGSNGKAALCSD
jgi:hypothetical protein